MLYRPDSAPGSAGNYLSFGDSKIIPGLPPTVLERILTQAALQVRTASALGHITLALLVVLVLAPPDLTIPCTSDP